MSKVRDDESLLLIATGQKIGEGFNYPRLDTLMLTAPISSSYLLEQYVGRLNRDYPGKLDITVYDYIDSHMRIFDSMYNKRLKTYRRIGFNVITNVNREKQKANHIYNSDNYKAVFERDLVEAERSIVISGRGLMYDKVYRIADLLQNRIESGVSVSVVLPAIELFADFDMEYYNDMVTFLESKGIEVDKVNSDNDLFAVIDENIVWHGTIDFLDKNDYWNNTLRVESASIASELLEILFDKETCV